MYGGGDRDYNDIVFQMNIKSVEIEIDRDPTLNRSLQRVRHYRAGSAEIEPIEFTDLASNGF
jgi:hypothetical protein